MFINCPNCGALVATDLVSDLPPANCPRCGFGLREAIAATSDPAPTVSPVPPPAPAASTPAPAAAAPAPPAATTPLPAAPAFVPLKPSKPVAPPERDAGAGTIADASGGTAPAEADTIAVPGGDAPAAPADPVAGNGGDADGAARPVPAVSPDSAARAPDADMRAVPAAGQRPESGNGTTAKPARPTKPKPAPSFADRGPRSAAGADAPRRHWPAVAAIFVLTLLLGLQLLLADRTRLAADPQWRPLLASVCGVFGCALPPWREPAAIALLQRDVRPHPELAGVLRVNATIRNDARWAQAWPQLALRLSDIDGRSLGERRFSPDEYLGGPPATAALSSGQSATIRMDVLEPSPHTVAFNFDFH